MPVRKFRSIDEVPEVWYAPGDPALFRTIARLWMLGRETLRLRFPPGVHKHRSIAEMNERQEEWDRLNFLAFQARRVQERTMGRKTELKEMHDQGRLDPVTYATERIGGTDHAPAFRSEARLPDGRRAEGVGNSRRAAEENAAAALAQKEKLTR